jgi:hypothetical protein
VIVIEVGSTRDREARAEARAFALSRAEASFAHDPALVGALARAAGRTSGKILFARDARGAVVGVLPLLLVSGPLGTTLASVAYLDDGGPLGDADARAALVRGGVELAARAGAALELRLRAPLEESAHPEHVRVIASTGKDVLVRELPDDPDEIARGLDAKTRNQLRRALREGLAPETGPATPQRLSAFHSVYSRTMRDLGSPPHGLALFEAIARAIGERARVVLVHDLAGAPLAGAFVIDDGRGRALLPWAASDRRADELSPNTLLYWELLRGAVERGVRSLDLGRSTRDGPAWRFKTRFGATPRPFVRTRLVARAGAGAPAERDAPGVALAASLLRRLPVSAARASGPILARWACL